MWRSNYYSFCTVKYYRRKILILLSQFSEIKHSSVRILHNVEIKSSAQSSMVSISQIKTMLRRSGFSFEDGFACISTPCPSCYTEKNGVLYINKITGFFICIECQHCGSWDTLGVQIENSKKTNKVDMKPVVKQTLNDNNVVCEGYKKWVKLKQSAKQFAKVSDTELEHIYQTFNLDNRVDHMMKELDVHCDFVTDTLYFPLKNGDKCIVGFKQISKLGDEISVPCNQCPGLLKYIPYRSRKKLPNAIVVQSVKDLIALSSYKLSYHIIGLPHGLMTLPQEVLPLLEQYTKVILWFGNDQVSLDSARVFSKKLGEQRCYFVRTTDDHPAPYLADKKGKDLLSIIDSAYPILHSKVTTFSSLRQDVLSDLQNNDKVRGVQWKRFPLLNSTLGGHRRGELTVLTGPTGCGKTTFMSEYSLDLAMQGVSTLWGSFEIRNQRLARTMIQQMVSLPLEKNLDKFEIWADQFEQYPIYFMTFHGPQPILLVMEAIQHATYIHDIAHVIIDNLQFMMGTSNTDIKYMDRFYKQDTIIGEFRTFATKSNCHVTLIIHPRKEKDTEELTVNSIFGGAKAAQEADNILIMQRKLLQSLQIKKYLQIAKNRFNGDLGVMPLIFDKPSLSFAQKKTDAKPS